jgi:ABC-type enterobactin transport system permease subunit
VFSALGRYDHSMEMGPDIASIAGVVGDRVRAAMLAALVANAKTRAVRVSHAGIREFDQQLGIDIPL